MKTISKILSIVLCLAMVVGFFTFGASAAEQTFTKVNVTAASDITEGYYLIYGTTGTGKTGFLSTTGATGTRMMSANLTISNGSVTTSDNAAIWKLTAVTGGFTVQNVATSNYLYYGDNSGNNIYSGDENKAGVWTVVSHDNVWTLQEVASSRQLSANDFGSDPNKYVGFAAYATTSSTKRSLEFYKLSSGSVEACTHEGEEKTLTMDATNHWEVCNGCSGIVGEKTPHTLTDGVCTCGYRAPVAPALGKTYKVGTLQVNNNTMVYLDGTITGRFLNTTTDVTKAADVFVEAAGSDTWYLFFMVEGEKSYIDLYVSDSAQGYVNARLNATPTVAYTYNTEHNTFLAPLSTDKYGDDLYMIAANGTYNTMGSSHDGNLGSYFPIHLYTAAEHTHTYGDDVTPGETGHYQTCTICGYKTPESAHADANNDQKCDGCGTNVACTHSWKDKTSDAKHWEECEHCGEKKGEADHSFTKKTSDAKHWEECTCGLKKGEADHSFTEGKCSCGATDPNYKAPEKEEDKKPAEPVIDYGVTAPKAGTAFKLGMYQENVGKYLYFNNTIPNAERPYYLGTTDKYSEAVDVYAEEVTGGYKLYFMDGTTKTYIDIYQNGTYVNARLTTEPTAVYTWNTEYKTFVTKVGDTEYYIGTYNTFETLSASKLSYAATSFPAHLYAEEPAPTADTSVISVAIAAAVLSVLGATALVMKKKEF